jgi:hypothetical protein
MGLFKIAIKMSRHRDGRGIEPGKNIPYASTISSKTKSGGIS